MIMLAPVIQEEIINGDNEALESVAEYKVRDLSFEMDWEKQIELWEKAKRGPQELSALSFITD